LNVASAVDCAHVDGVLTDGRLPWEVPLHPCVVVQRVTEFGGLPWAIVDRYLNFCDAD